MSREKVLYVSLQFSDFDMVIVWFIQNIIMKCLKFNMHLRKTKKATILHIKLGILFVNYTTKYVYF